MGEETGRQKGSGGAASTKVTVTKSQLRRGRKGEAAKEKQNDRAEKVRQTMMLFRSAGEK